jgi:hypothetical protein
VVSKPTGRPRGRPRKPRPPRRPKAGRPLLDFRNDPDRYAVALLDAMLALEMGPERWCSGGVAGWMCGIEFFGPFKLKKLKKYPGHIAASWPRNRRRDNAGTLDGKATTLRIKQRRCRNIAEAVWRKVMAGAFMLVIGARDQEAIRPIILQRATAVGEGAFAKRVMLPMVGAKISLPEFPTNLISTHEAV